MASNADKSPPRCTGVPRRGELYVCCYCRGRFSEKGIRTHYDGTYKQRDHICRRCGNGFKSEAELEKHMLYGDKKRGDASSSGKLD